MLASQTRFLVAQDDVRPDEIQFRRQAVVRLVFDASQNIPLASLRPDKIFDLQLMHPEKLPNAEVKWDLENGQLAGSSPGVDGSSLLWVGGFNPFATYDLVVENAQGSGSVGLSFSHSYNNDSLIAALRFENGKPEAVTWRVLSGGQPVVEEKWPVPPGIVLQGLTLRAQMSAVGVNVFLESAGRSPLVGCSDFAQHLDLRERARIQQMDFALRADLKADAQVMLAGASSCFSPGTGQADIRAIAHEEGAPLLDDGRL